MSDVVVDADVVVIGAGPTGLLSALLLADRGHRVALIEKWPEPYPMPRAVGINHETLRILQTAGLIDVGMPDLYFTPDGRRVRQLLTAEGEVLSTLTDSGTSVSGWPERASFSQPNLERTLNDKAVAHQLIEVLRGWVATDTVDDGTDITVVARAHGDECADRALTVHARFLIGCDGANSIVRRGELAEVEDLGFAYDWLVVDVVPHEERPFTPNLGQIFGPPRPTTLVGGGPRRRRWEFMLLDGETHDEMNRADTAWALLAPYDVRPENAVLERHAVYTFRARWATRWHIGHTVLAGDAAHLMPPFLGEGFNSGVRDAIAATWRIDLILRGLAGDSLLDSYETERVWHVRKIIEQAVELGRMICMTDPVHAAARNERFRNSAREGLPNVRPPQWRLGQGLWTADDPIGGYLGVQGRIRHGETIGLLHDVIDARGFTLVSMRRDPLASVPGDTLDSWRALGGTSVDFSTDLEDVDGTYEQWFDERTIEIALFRPDFYTFATSSSGDDAGRLIGALVQALQRP